jgi:uncharacterized membrane protein YtjA (UPF0391 family)
VPHETELCWQFARNCWLARLLLYAFADWRACAHQTKDLTMLHWAAVFFVIALLAAVFGFGGIAASAVGVAKILFVVFLVLAVVSLIFGRRVST